MFMLLRIKFQFYVNIRIIYKKMQYVQLTGFSYFSELDQIFVNFITFNRKLKAQSHFYKSYSNFKKNSLFEFLRLAICK